MRTSRLAALVFMLLFTLVFTLLLLALPNGLARADTAYCTYCGRVTNGLIEYDPNDGFDPPTCTKAGYGLFNCDICDSFSEVTVPALGHSYAVSTAKEPTCEEAGEELHQCTRCGDSYTVPMDALSHNYVFSTNTATCTEEGANIYKCSRCGATRSDPVAAYGHDYVVTTAPATCEEAGEELHQCTRCGDSYTVPIATLDHDYELTEDVLQTCTEAGHTTRVCSRCGDVESEEQEAFGHWFVYADTVAASCLDEGDTIRACLRCGEEEHTPIPAKGHSWGAWVTEKEATGFAEGLESRTCTRCGEREERAIAQLPPTGTPVGTGVVVVGAVVILAGVAFAVKKILAARAAAKAARVAKHAFEAFKLTEKRIFAKLEMEEESNRTFIDTIKARPNLSVTLADEGKEATLSEQLEEADPDAVILDFTGSMGLDEAVALVDELAAAKEDLVFELVAFGADDAVCTRLDKLKDAGTIARYAFAGDNRFVKVSKLIVPLYKDMMKDADSVEAIGIVAEMFGIPAVPEVLEVLAKVEHAGEIVDVVKDKFSGVDMEAEDGLTVINALSEILGLEGVAAVSELIEDLGDTVESIRSDEEGEVHRTYKAGEVAKDVGDVIGSLLG